MSSRLERLPPAVQMATGQQPFILGTMLEPAQPAASLPPFVFKEKTGYVNWEQISHADVQALERSGDLGMIQSYAQGLVYAQLRKEDIDQMGDSRFAKLFKLSQLSIEYLLYTQDYLENVAKSCDLEYAQLQKQCVEAENVAKANRDKISKLKKELKVKKRSIGTYDFLIKQASKSKEEPVYPCRVCKDKYYTSKKALYSHYRRRHPNDVMPAEEEAKSRREKKENRAGESNKADQEAKLTDKVNEVVQVRVREIQDLLETLNTRVMQVAEEQRKAASVSEKDREMLLTKERLELEERKREVERLEIQKSAKSEAEMPRPAKKRPELSQQTIGEMSVAPVEAKPKIKERTEENVPASPQKKEQKIDTTIETFSIEHKKRPEEQKSPSKEEQVQTEEARTVPKPRISVAHQESQDLVASPSVRRKPEADAAGAVPPKSTQEVAVGVSQAVASPPKRDIKKAIISNPTKVSTDVSLELYVRPLTNEEVPRLITERDEEAQQDHRMDELLDEKDRDEAVIPEVRRKPDMSVSNKVGKEGKESVPPAEEQKDQPQSQQPSLGLPVEELKSMMISQVIKEEGKNKESSVKGESLVAAPSQAKPEGQSLPAEEKKSTVENKGLTEFNTQIIAKLVALGIKERFEAKPADQKKVRLEMQNLRRTCLSRRIR